MSYAEKHKERKNTFILNSVSALLNLSVGIANISQDGILAFRLSHFMFFAIGLFVAVSAYLGMTKAKRRIILDDFLNDPGPL